MRARGALVLIAMFAACAADAPSTSFDSSAGLVAVDIAADGFVRADGRRIPLEACVLELRQRTRAMTAGELSRFVVQLRTDAQEPGSETEANVRHALNRLLDELQVMGVRQILCD